MSFSHNKFKLLPRLNWIFFISPFYPSFLPPPPPFWFITLMLWLINIYVACYRPCECRKQCFTTEFFKGCLEALQLQDEVNAIKSYIKLVNGADPNLSSNWDAVCCPFSCMQNRFVGSWHHFPFSPTHKHTHLTPQRISTDEEEGQQWTNGLK